VRADEIVGIAELVAAGARREDQVDQRQERDARGGDREEPSHRDARSEGDDRERRENDAGAESE
jgi:hypothetical protein